jgi:hypothetical protein
MRKTLTAQADVDQLCARIEALTPNDTRRWGKMSVGEMVVHVREAYCMVLEDRKVGDLKMPIPRGLIRWLALRVPRQWPQGVETIPELKVDAPGMGAGEFDADKAGLLAALERFAGEANLERRHPIFGPMRPVDWMRWGYLHADHHLRQFGR